MARRGGKFLGGTGGLQGGWALPYFLAYQTQGMDVLIVIFLCGGVLLSFFSFLELDPLVDPG